MIPDFQSAMLPILSKMKDEKIYDSTMIRNIVVEHFEITKEEKQVKTPNGKQLLYYNRITWPISYLRTGGLIESPERGKYKISELGKKVLNNPPEKITIRFLKDLNPDKNLFEREKKKNLKKNKLNMTMKKLLTN